MSVGGSVSDHAAKNKFLVGLIGEGIQESLFPTLHEQEARCQGFPVDRDHERAETLARSVAEPRGVPCAIHNSSPFVRESGPPLREALQRGGGRSGC